MRGRREDPEAGVVSDRRPIAKAVRFWRVGEAARRHGWSVSIYSSRIRIEASIVSICAMEQMPLFDRRKRFARTVRCRYRATL